MLIPATERGLLAPLARDLWTLVRARADTTPDLLFAVDEADRRMTFGEYATAAERAAAGLQELGVGAGTRVSWQLPTRLEAMVLVGALARLGALQNPCLPIFRERELRFVLGQVRPEIFVVAGASPGVDAPALARGVLDELKDAGLRCELVVADPELPDADPTTLADPLPLAAAGQEPVRWVFYSSGTTADPKGARHTDATIIAGALGQATRFEMSAADRYGIVFPFTHVGGIGTLGTQMLSGCGAIVVERYDPDTTPELFARHGLTMLAGGTPMAVLTLEAQRRRPGRPLYPDLRLVIAGAAPKPPGLHAAVRQEIGGRGTVSVYGLTEAPLAAVSAVVAPDETLATFEGTANLGTDIRIVDVASDAVCPPGVVGEIRVRGAIVCRGFLDPQRDGEAFDAEGWLRTGDLGFLDADGNLAVTGRLKDIIIRKGENISAKEVEDVLFEHPSIAEVAVFGLPDDARGERCCAAVVLRGDADADAIDLAGIAAFCRTSGLAAQKIPEQLEIVAALPRNASGKVLKAQLQEEFSR